MGKPLLTDEMIERANRGEDISGPPMMDDEETKVISTAGRGGFGYSAPRRNVTQDTLKIEVEPTVTKSRRIENQKRSIFQAKLNRILFWIVILLVVLIAAIIWL
ncbi:cell wall synthase accessory phosphoprotein MacP [Streptococcus sinensis]|uniref:cell wall synthase accessory phosphoprotein MacP n=1 Tax=Streptococcus sinensis TaxID=176090 RepID=UPI001F42965A|nr:cell wall synthase accessory phosphoprotein MacP [Streptococcus sinensis]MCF1284589.1 cell wall synthase accessory phosphoprotein MacP [Streptococcus sinensis]